MATSFGGPWSSGNTITSAWANLLDSAVNNIQVGTAIATSGGSANAQTLTPSPAMSALVAGQMVAFSAGYTNTGTCTLNVSGLGAANLQINGTNAAAGAIVAGTTYLAAYNGTHWQLLGATSFASLSGTAGLAQGGTNANLSSTGGTRQYLKQSTSGGAVSVGTIAMSDLGTGTPSSSNYLRGDGSWQTISSTPALSALTAGTLGVTLALGTQVITSTASSSWTTTTGQYLYLGTEDILLGLGLSNGSQGDNRWALGQFAAGGSANYSYPGLFSDGSNIFENVPSGNYKLGEVGGTAQFALGYANGSAGATSWALGQYGANGSAANAYPGLYSTGTHIFCNVPTGDYWTQYIGGTPNFYVGYNAVTTTFGSGSWGLGIYGSSGSASSAGMASGGSNLYANVPTGASHLFSVNGANIASISSSGLTLTGALTLGAASSPASSSTGTTGQLAWDSNYIYVCTSTNTWKRAALTGGY